MISWSCPLAIRAVLSPGIDPKHIDNAILYACCLHFEFLKSFCLIFIKSLRFFSLCSECVVLITHFSFGLH